MALFTLLENKNAFFRDDVAPALDRVCAHLQDGIVSLIGDKSVIGSYFCSFVEGAWVTVELSALALAIGLVLALPVALARLSRNRLLKWPAYGYMFYFRGTPLLVQIFLIYYGAGQLSKELRDIDLWIGLDINLWDGLFREAYFCAVLTLVLNTTAYSAEIIRGAIRNVPHGEIEAARSCGMSGVLLYRRIILPKAARIALPAYTNEVVFLFQATSVVSYITLLDLTGVARDVKSATFRDFEVWSFTLVIYVVISYGIFWLFKRLERRMLRHLDRKASMTVAKVA